MTGIFNSGGEVTPYINQQDGSGEVNPSKVYANLQDGNGEQLIWEAKTLVDGYEDGDHSEYVQWSNWSIQTTGGLNGTANAARASGSAAGEMRRHGNGEFPRGCKFEYYFKIESGGRLITHFGASTDALDDHYEVWHFADTSATHLVSDSSGGGNNTMMQTSSNYAGDTEYLATVWYGVNGDELRVVVENASTGTQVAEVTANDTKFSGDGFGAYSYSSSWAMVDEWSRY